MKDLIIESVVFAFLVVFIGIMLAMLSPVYFKAKLSPDAKENYEKYVVELVLFVSALVGYFAFKYTNINGKVRSLANQV